MKKLIDLLSSLGLSIVLLLILGLLTWLGTLEQVEHGLYLTQKKYFESFLLWHDFGPSRPAAPGCQPGALAALCELDSGRPDPDPEGRVDGRDSGHARRDPAALAVGVRQALPLAGRARDALRGSERGLLPELLPLGARRDRGDSQEECASSSCPRNSSSMPPDPPARGASSRFVWCPATFPFDLELEHFMANSSPLPKGPMFDVDVPIVDGFFLREETARGRGLAERRRPLRHGGDALR